MRAVVRVVVRSTLLCALFVAAIATPAAAQRSLAPPSPRGLSVTPVYEGWYRNADGTYSLSFGYFNRNTDERVMIAVGDSNFVSPGAADQGQPTFFSPRRHWGTFVIVVPADFGATKTVTWTLKSRGETYAIPGRLHPDWQIDAIEGEASTNNTPPELRFVANGAAGRGPGAVRGGPIETRVGVPTTLTVLVADDAKTGSTGANGTRIGIPVDLSWFTHQGPAAATFAAPTSRLTPTGGTGTTTATFPTAGTYVIRVRAGDLSATTAGHAQCCWSNGFLTVRVVP